MSHACMPSRCLGNGLGRQVKCIGAQGRSLCRRTAAVHGCALFAQPAVAMHVVQRGRGPMQSPAKTLLASEMHVCGLW